MYQNATALPSGNSDARTDGDGPGDDGGSRIHERERITAKLRSIVDIPEHYLDGLKGIPGYVLRVGRFRVVLDWNRDGEVIYVVAVLERKHDYRELGRLGEVWGAWRE